MNEESRGPSAICFHCHAEFAWPDDSLLHWRCPCGMTLNRESSKCRFLRAHEGKQAVADFIQGTIVERGYRG